MELLALDNVKYTLREGQLLTRVKEQDMME